MCAFFRLRRCSACLALIVLLSGSLGACTSTLYLNDTARYQRQIERLEQRLRAHPDDTATLRDLGVLHLRLKHFNAARPYLERAFAQDPADPVTRFYYGLALETTGDAQGALRAYEGYVGVSRLSPYRRLLAGRYQWLIRKVVRAELQERLAADPAGTEANVEPGTVAVIPFTYQGEDPRYAVLGRGLAEMLSVDLSQVRALRVVERVRLQVLLDELALAQSAAVDPGTAPRVGRLLGAQRLVGGSYDILDGDVLRADVLTWDVGTATPVNRLDSRSEALDALFALEKDLAFSLIAEMGIELTPEERERIEFVPTRNLQAFLAYSRGLAQEDAGQFDQAARSFQEALSIDPSFEAAGERAEAAAGTSLAEQTPAESAAEAAGAEQALATPTVDPLGDRLSNLNASIEAAYVPSDETRTNPADEPRSAALPAPPRPPERD